MQAARCGRRRYRAELGLEVKDRRTADRVGTQASPHGPVNASDDFSKTRRRVCVSASTRVMPRPQTRRRLNCAVFCFRGVVHRRFCADGGGSPAGRMVSLASFSWS